MFESICILLLSAAYISSLEKESKDEKDIKEQARIKELKISVFCYAIRHGLLYNEVVRRLQNNELTFEYIRKNKKYD